MSEMPKNLIELIYLLAPGVVSAATTLGIVFLIANQVDTELYAVGGAGISTLAAQLIAKKLQG